jgi:hypothetical protein
MILFTVCNKKTGLLRFLTMNNNLTITWILKVQQPSVFFSPSRPALSGKH